MISRQLILIKHSQPILNPAVPANRWVLSAEGIRRCAPLAEKLRHFTFSTVYTSQEPKASQTARLVAEHLGKSWQIFPDLHEHELGEHTAFSDTAAFQDCVAELFTHQGETVYGIESGQQAASRFDRALNSLIASTDGDLCVIAHGRVICLFIARHNKIDGFSLWKRLGLPSLVALHLPGLKLREVVENIT